MKILLLKLIFLSFLLFSSFINCLLSLKMSSIPKKILLGSGSSTRKAICTEMGFSFDVVKADIDERALGDRSTADNAQELVLLLANKKADAIISKLKNENSNTNTNLPWYSNLSSKILLTADQVVTHEGKILEKPINELEAREFITGYGKSPCSTIGSCVLTNLETGVRVEGIHTATIHFNPIPESTINDLIAEGEVYYCAGGLMVEHVLVQPHITKMDGSEASVMGLCKDLVQSLWIEINS